MKKPSEMSKEELIARLDAAYAEIKPQTDLIMSEHRADMIARFVRDHAEDVLDFENGYTFDGLCCTNHVRDSSCKSSVVAGRHEQTDTPDLQDQELAGL